MLLSLILVLRKIMKNLIKDSVTNEFMVKSKIKAI